MTTWKKINKQYPQSIRSPSCQVKKKIININSKKKNNKTEDIYVSQDGETQPN